MGTKRTNETGQIDPLVPQGAETLKTFICLYPSYPVLKFGQVLPINWDMAQNVICKGHDLERSRS